MQASMLFLPSGAAVPAVGAEVDVQVRFTATAFDRTVAQRRLTGSIGSWSRRPPAAAAVSRTGSRHGRRMSRTTTAAR